MYVQSHYLSVCIVLMVQPICSNLNDPVPPTAVPAPPPSVHPSAHIRRFSTKTAYNASIAMDLRHENDANQASGDAKGATHYLSEGGRECRPMQVVGLFRHGTRFPGLKDILNIRKALTKIQSAATIRLDFMRTLADSVDKFSVEEEKQLAHAGREEHRALGARFGARFVKLFDVATARTNIEFISSDKSRTIDSCTSFQEGFASTIASFTEDSSFSRSDLREHVLRDDLLRFFDLCPTYVESVTRNKSALAEAHKFKMEAFPSIAERIGKIFGAQKRIDFTTAEMKSMYVIAASELAIHGTSSWDQLFTDEDLDILEYAADIKNYWKKSYGYPINYEHSCVLLQHMFDHMEDLINRASQTKGAFYFGHTETVVPVLSLLGLFRDAVPLRANNFRLHTARQFRTSRVAPFSSNLAFVLYECISDPDSENKESFADEDRFVVELLFKERPLVIPACGETACPYALVREHYAEILDRCDFEEMCSAEESVHEHGEL